MSKLAEQFVKYTRDHGYGQKEFQEAIDQLYAISVDTMLDDAPEGERQHTETFGAHKLVITSHREFLN